MFSSRKLGLLLVGGALLAVGLGWSWRAWRYAHPEPVVVRRIALLPIDNQSADSGLNWADAALREGALLLLGQQVGQGAQTSVFLARDASEAAASQATHLVYGRLDPGKNAASINYSFSLEDVARHAMVRRVRDSGSLLKATSALAAFVATAADVQSLRPVGVDNDQALEFFATRKYAECTATDPRAFWCWERWASASFEADKQAEALSILARGRQQGSGLPAFARARLDLLEASIRGDEAMRLAALERLVQADATNVATAAELASALMSNRRFSQAEKLYRAVLERSGSQPEFWNLLAYAEAGQGRFDEARKSLMEYDRLAPAGPNPPDSRGEIEWMAGNLAGASTWFLDSYRRDAQFNAGVALEKAALSRYLAGDSAGAEELANRFLSDREQAGDALAAFHRARWQYLWGNAAGAEALLKLEVQRGGPDAAIAASRLMLGSMRENDIPAARKWANIVRELSTKPGVSFLSRVADALIGGDDKAVSDRSVRSELVAMRLTFSGNFDRALDAWDDALRAPHVVSDAFAREMKAWCLLRAGRGAESAGMVKGGWPLLDSDDRLLFDFLIYPNLLYVRAEAAATRGDSAEARRLYDVYVRYAGTSKDRFGQVDKARAASRL